MGFASLRIAAVLVKARPIVQRQGDRRAPLVTRMIHRPDRRKAVQHAS